MPCYSPIWVENVKEFERIPVPCGKCVDCRKRRVDSWVFRLLQEDRVSRSSHFITLTYNTLALPLSDRGLPTLRKADLQAFFKRLRKNTGIQDIKYYAAGEYGTETNRPHYHAIVFNCGTAASYQDAWALTKAGRNGYLARYNKGLSPKDWKDPIPDIQDQEKCILGNVHVGQVTGNSIAYTCKYIDKTQGIQYNDKDDRQVEFSLMSKGLGDSYLTPEIIAYHKANLDQLYVTGPGGYKVPMPKYYRDKIFSDEEKDRQLHMVDEAVTQILAEEMELCERKGIDYATWRGNIQRDKKERVNKRSKNRKL